MRLLADWIKAPEQASLRRTFVSWITRVVFAARLKGQEVPEVTELHELDAMLSETVKEWTREWMEEGLQKGLQEGLEKGLQEGLEKGLQEGEEKGKRLGRCEVLSQQIEAEVWQSCPQQMKKKAQVKAGRGPQLDALVQSGILFGQILPGKEACLAGPL